VDLQKVNMKAYKTGTIAKQHVWKIHMLHWNAGLVPYSSCGYILLARKSSNYWHYFSYLYLKPLHLQLIKAFWALTGHKFDISWLNLTSEGHSIFVP
jgi:hypothetical protein